jgi:hypothetical protein
MTVKPEIPIKEGGDAYISLENGIGNYQGIL